MNDLMVAICEDRAEDEERMVQILESLPEKPRYALFSEAPAFVEDFTPGIYDLILMDIYLEDEQGNENPDGVTAVRKIRAIDPQVPIAFVTTSKDHALDAFRLNVSRYIEKPVSAESVEDALRFALAARTGMAGVQIRSDGRDVNVPASHIIYAEQQGHYVEFAITGSRTVRARAKLDDIEPQLAANQFLRTHKSYLVNLAFVTDVDQDLSALKMLGGSTVPVRRGSLPKIRRAWEDWMFEMVRLKA